MRGATQCARRLRQLFRSLRTKLGKVSRPRCGDPVTEMILGIFSRDVPEAKAREALDRLRGLVVDYNELRVVPPIEMAEMLGDFPEGRLKCEDLSRALNAVFMCEHEVSLEGLRGCSRSEAVRYLDALDGLDPYSRARVRLRGLQQHAIPLDEAMWAYARKMQVVDRRCSLEAAEAFLERRIPEDEALEFVALLERQAWAEMGPVVRNREVARIASVPPDRTARNMLQLVAAGRSLLAPEAGSAARRSSAAPAKRGTARREARRPGRTKPKARTSRKAAGAGRSRRGKASGRAVARTPAPGGAGARATSRRAGKPVATARSAAKHKTARRARAAKGSRRPSKKGQVTLTGCQPARAG